MLVITAFLHGEMLYDFAFQTAQLIKPKVNKRDVKSASI